MTGTLENVPAAEEQVAQWVVDTCRSLGLPVDSDADDFFAVGGTSLTVVRLVARAEETFGEDCLPPDDMYEQSSLRDIAALIVRNATPWAASGRGHPAPPTQL